MDAVFDHGMERGVRHGSTFGNNDLAAPAGLATLDVLRDEDLVGHAARLGDLLLELTTPLIERYEIVRAVRGLGLMWAIELGPPPSGAARRVWDLAERAQPGLAAQLLTVPLFHEHRILCQVAGHHMNVVKALPALVAGEDDIRRFAAALDDVIASRSASRAYGRLGAGMARRLMRPVAGGRPVSARHGGGGSSAPALSSNRCSTPARRARLRPRTTYVRGPSDGGDILDAVP
jgi:ornithine--oxo-acid transaminase